MQKLVDRLRSPALVFRIVGGLAVIAAWNSPAEQQFLWATEEAVGAPVDRIMRPNPATYQAAVEHVQHYGWHQGAGLVLDHHGERLAVAWHTQRVEGVDGDVDVDHFLVVLARSSFFPQIANDARSATSCDTRHVVLRATYEAGIDSGMPSGVTTVAVDYRKRIGRNISLARHTATPPLSQKDLVALVNLSPRVKIGRSQLSDWERGRYEIGHEVLERIAEVTGTPGAPDIGWFYNRHEGER